MFSQSMNPVIEGGMIYPKMPSPRNKNFICPTCGSTNKSRITSIVYKDSVREINKALNECNKWAKGKNLKIEGYNLCCEWDNTNWYVSSELILNSIITDQMVNIWEYTNKTKVEFGSLIIKSDRGIYLDMTQIGEEMSVDFRITRELKEDEYILGSVHSHPYTDVPSKWDIATFLLNDWEKISIVIGAEQNLNVMIKTLETIKPVEDIESSIKKWENSSLDLSGIANEMKFLVYRGQPLNLTQIMGENMSSITLEKLFGNIEGCKVLL